jgi:hypothetical protein
MPHVLALLLLDEAIRELQMMPTRVDRLTRHWRIASALALALSLLLDEEDQEGFRFLDGL